MEPKLPDLYLITDRKQTGGRALINVIEQALEGGIRFVQLREKDLSDRELLSLGTEIRELADRYGATLLINDRVDIAIAARASGVHFGRNGISVQDARQAFSLSLVTSHSSPLVGVSTHSVDEALEAEAEGADFITFGPVYYTSSKAAYGEPVGIEKVKEVVKAVNIPIYALGGIKEENIGEVLSTDVHGIAMISAIISAMDVRKATEEILRTITDHRPASTDHKLS